MNGVVSGSNVGGFVGRRDELRRIEHALRADADTATVVLITAAAGFGKTALIDAVIDTVLPRVAGDATVHRASPTEVEADVSWSTLRMLCRQRADGELPRAVATAIGRGVATDAPAVSDVAFAWAELLRDEALRHPTVVVLDDLHWVDRATATAIASAMRSAPARWIIGARSGADVPIDVDRLLPPEQVTVVEPGRLRRVEIGELVHQRFDRHWTPAALRFIDETSEGHPLHAIELARELHHGSAPPAAGRTLSQLYGDRLDALAPTARDVVALAALATHPTATLLHQLRPAVDLDGALDQLERAGLVQVGLDSVRFTHALARRAVLERLGTVERARLHRELAAHADDPEDEAFHLGEGTTRPDETIAARLEEAGMAAFRRGATEDAARAFTRAAALTPRAQHAGAAARRAALAGIAHTDHGDPEAAEPLLRDALGPDLAPGFDDVDLVADTFLAATITADRLHGGAAARRITEAALAHLRDGPTRARLLRTLVRLEQLTDLRAAEQTALGAVADALRTGGDAEVFAAEAALANVRFLRGERIDLDALIARLAEHRGPLGGQSAASLIQELVAWDDRYEVARELVDALIDDGRRTGSLSTVANALSQAANIEMRAGDIATARKHVDEILDLVAPRRGAATFDASDDLLILTALAGDADGTTQLIADIEAEVDRINPVMQIAFHAYAGLAEITLGRTDAARRHLERAAELGDALGLDDGRGLGHLADLAEVLVQSGALERAGTVVDRLGELARRSGSHVVTAAHHRTAGLLAAATGRPDAAIAHLTDAVHAAEAARRPLELGRALLALGTALRKQGARTRAREQLERARALFVQLDSPPWTARADAELARLGTRTATQSVLSPTERRIAELATQGRSNREIAAELIVSLRTVESNLSRAYRKLGVRGRTELAARGAELLAD